MDDCISARFTGLGLTWWYQEAGPLGGDGVRGGHEGGALVVGFVPL